MNLLKKGNKDMKKNNKKGFTLAELLIVVAIIAVLVAIAIPIFTTQLERSRETADIANVRSAYADAVSEYLTTGDEVTVTVDATQTQADWKYVEGKIGTDITVGSSKSGKYDVPCHVKGEQFKITIKEDGTVEIA